MPLLTTLALTATLAAAPAPLLGSKHDATDGVSPTRILEPRTLKPVAGSPVMDGYVFELSPDRTRIAAAGVKDVRVYSTRSGRRLRTIPYGSRSQVVALAWIAEDRLLAVHSGDRSFDCEGFLCEKAAVDVLDPLAGKAVQRVRLDQAFLGSARVGDRLLIGLADFENPDDLMNNNASVSGVVLDGRGAVVQTIPVASGAGLFTGPSERVSGDAIILDEAVHKLDLEAGTIAATRAFRVSWPVVPSPAGALWISTRANFVGLDPESLKTSRPRVSTQDEGADLRPAGDGYIVDGRTYSGAYDAKGKRLWRFRRGFSDTAAVGRYAYTQLTGRCKRRAVRVRRLSDGRAMAERAGLWILTEPSRGRNLPPGLDGVTTEVTYCDT